MGVGVRIQLDRELSPFIVYANFNCPCCCAHNRRTHQLDLGVEMQWRMIQHVPQASTAHTTLQDIAELTSEVTQLRRRAPDIPINAPSFRPNSGPATTRYLRALV